MSCIAIGIDCFAGGASAPATPLSIFGASLIVWARADIGIATVSGKVSAWADQSGNGNNFAQATAGNRPAFNTAPLNGKPTVRFSSVGQTSLLCANYLTDAAPGLFALVGTPLQTSSTQAMYSSDAAVYITVNGFNTWGPYNCVGQSISVTPSALIANVHAGPTVDLYNNGALSAGVAGYSNNNRGSTRLGSDASATTQWVDMDLGEFIKLNRAATAPEIAALRAYFTSFWGFAA